MPSRQESNEDMASKRARSKGRKQDASATEESSRARSQDPSIYYRKGLAVRQGPSISDDGFDQILSLERVYVDGKLRKMEASLDKRLHEMTSRLRTEIAGELLQQVVICQDSMSKKLETSELAVKRRITEAIDWLQQNTTAEISQQFDGSIAEQKKTMLETQRDVADVKCSLQDMHHDYREEQKVSSALFESELQALRHVPTQFDELQRDLDCMRAKLPTCLYFCADLEDKLSEHTRLISDALGQIEEVRHTVENVSAEVETSMQTAALESSALHPDSQPFSQISASLAVSKAVMIQSDVRDMCDEFRLSQDQQDKEAGMAIAKLQIDLNSLRVDLFAEASRRKDLSKAVEKWHDTAQSPSDCSGNDWQKSENASLSLRLQAVEHQLERLQIPFSPGKASTFEPSEGNVGVQCFDISDFGHSEVTVFPQFDNVPEMTALLQTSLEAIQGDLERLDHEIIAERLDRHTAVASVSAVGCDLQKHVGEIVQRVEKLEQRAQDATARTKTNDSEICGTAWPRLRAALASCRDLEAQGHSDGLLAVDMSHVAVGITSEQHVTESMDASIGARADGDTIHGKDFGAASSVAMNGAEPISPWSLSHKTARGRTGTFAPCLELEFGLDSPEPAKASPTIFADEAAILDVASPSRRARRGRQGHHMASSASPTKSVPASWSECTKDDQEPDEQFLQEFAGKWLAQ